ncbi:hypothetical protein [Rugamonas apoptosis]|uniref:Lipoprotein n=1 Tax=Rugamonas apoptosis TaxID=2758570 RepID=A0A7W2F7D2_9BURK|nr:hypothetical protein [Rugamonas apoptosis]MBA5686369.1 hypothetical protein [Rugamonas apoptosis]
MKPSLAVLLSCSLLSSLLLGACSWLPSRARDEAEAAAAAQVAAARQPAPRTVAADGTPLVRVDGVEIEKVPFQAGVSSTTVERLARQRECVGGLGAGLISAPGPVEIYRMACDNGKVFMARCELRQCKAM